MITLTRMDGSIFVLNAELIEFIEAHPDTVVSTTSGRKVVVLEAPEDIVKAVIAYKQHILAGPHLGQES
jgi:flagellar protein FlbD